VTLESPAGIEHFDVLIVGAGLSGIGAACHLRRRCPQHRFALLESRDTLGGTWDLFRYPGIRSDSDMYTLGYSFRPWTEPRAIADGPSILRYLRETAAEYDLLPHIRYRHRVVSAAWSSESATWRVEVARGEQATPVILSCNFLLSCSGYYDYDQGYTPAFAGQEDFTGRLVHAQHWPEGLDYRGKRVVVIGSGATAVTLVPELAKQAASTVMLQRSPTYIASVPSEDGLARRLRGWLPAPVVYRLIRWKRVLFQMYVYNISRRRPREVKRYLVNLVRRELGPGFDVETHFTPRYNPWDQRLCAVPDSDMFAAIREKRAEVVTDHIERFTPRGIELRSGRELEADIVVLATGLNMQFMGNVALTVDGRAVVPSEQLVYRGMMLSDVPNMAQVFGYTNSSWTLKADLTSEYVCRLLRHMRRSGARKVVARLRPGETGEEPLLDFSAGYVLRARDRFPRQGSEKPWRVHQNYLLDFLSLRFSSLTHTALEFS
jgi:cation diffusion facilitator CzcD-associated flavoprotein CzcO